MVMFGELAIQCGPSLDNFTSLMGLESMSQNGISVMIIHDVNIFGASAQCIRESFGHVTIHHLFGSEQNDFGVHLVAF